MHKSFRILAALGFTLVSTTAVAQESEQWRAMNRPVEPFRIAGNLYYVGANSVTSFLIVTPEGHVLIDGGFAETAPIIEAGIEKLGFRLEDVKILLNSHAHFDHAGGLAELKKKTGARMVASAAEAPLLERGGAGDDLLGDEGKYAPVVVDERLEDGGQVTLGGVTLTAHVTAGHTRGCTSWAFDVSGGEETHHAVSICSLSVLPGMRFGDEPTYPGIEEDFRASYEKLRGIPCDLFLASHAGFFKMKHKRERIDESGGNPFVDPEGYRDYIRRAEQRLDEAIEKENAP